MVEFVTREDGTLVEEEVEHEVVPTLAEYLGSMVQIERFAYTPMGTFGRLSYKDFSCFTVEKPWANNAPFISCIPIGLYPITYGMFYQTEKPYHVWELGQVPNRTLIDIHRGNTMESVKGCVALGTELGVVDKLWAVLNSTKAHTGFMSAMKANEDKRLFIHIHDLEKGTWSTAGYASVGG